MGFFDKIFGGLSKTRSNMAELEELFQGYQPDSEDFYEELEELLVLADVGAATAQRVDYLMRRATWEKRFRKGDEAREGLIEVLSGLLNVGDAGLKLDTRPSVILMVGVNGVGKTTTIAKLAYRERMQGKKVLIAAADTFRAAAVEQLEVWAKRIGADFHAKGMGADPAAVAYEAMDRAIKGGYDVLFIDTAGRLHTKSNLMDELRKIRMVLGRKMPAAPHRTILVIDATTGQNALQQTKIFKENSGVNEIILTKLDGTAKGGIALAIRQELEVPVWYVGVGEGIDDLQPFNAKDFVEALF
jgi:fused signal recognition particle receptor